MLKGKNAREPVIIKANGLTSTLYCADCLDILPTLEAGSVDAVITDPPYGHNNNNGDLIAKWESALGKGKPGPPRPIANDGPEAGELYQQALRLLYDCLAPGCCCCCCGGGGGPDPQFARWSLWLDEVFQFKQMVIWDKGPMGMGWHYRRSYEVVLVGEKPGAACRWFDTTSRIENIIRHIPKIIPAEDQHPTIKPVPLAEHFIRLHAAPGQLILDPFMGSGTTGVAATRQGCNFIGIEIEPKYFDIAEKRIRAEMAQGRLPLKAPEEGPKQATIPECS